jgi:hypothetical protein
MRIQEQLDEQAETVIEFHQLAPETTLCDCYVQLKNDPMNYRVSNGMWSQDLKGESTSTVLRQLGRTILSATF